MGFLQGMAQTLDLQPAAEAFNTARRRREDRKEKIEDQDRTELLGWQKDAARAGVTMPERGPDEDPYTSGDYRGALGDFNSPDAINARKQAEEVAKSGLSEEAWKKAQQEKNRLEEQQRKKDAEKLGSDWVDPAVIEARRAKQKEDERRRIAAAAKFGRKITNDRGQIDPLKEEEFLAEVAKERELKNAVLELKRAGVSQMEINNRKVFIKDEIPIYKRELDFYAQSASSPEGAVDGKSIPKMDAIRASIERMEAGNAAEKIAAIRNDMTRLRETLAEGPDGGTYGKFKQSEGERAQGEKDEEAALRQERVKDWRGDDSQSTDWLGGERPKASVGPLTPGQSPITPGTSPLLVNPDAAATPPPEEAPTTTPLPGAETPVAKPPPEGAAPGPTEDELNRAFWGAGGTSGKVAGPATTATLPDTVGTTPAPGERPVDPKAKAKEQEVMGQIQREQDATQPRPENIMLTPEELQERYANTDLSIQERFYNPGSLRISSLAEGQGFGWQGLVGVGGKNFAQFNSPKAGMDALKQQLRIDRDRKKEDGSPFTVGDFVKKYVGEDADPEGVKKALKNYPKLLGKNAPNGLDTNIKDIEFQALLKAVMTNENHTADSLSVFQRYMEDTPLDPSTQTPGVNPIMEGAGGLGDKAVDVKKMDEGALIEALAPKTGQPELDWDTLSPEDKAWIQKNRPNIYNVIAGN